MDMSLLEVDVQPTYVRVTVKEKGTEVFLNLVVISVASSLIITS